MQMYRAVPQTEKKGNLTGYHGWADPTKDC